MSTLEALMEQDGAEAHPEFDVDGGPVYSHYIDPTTAVLANLAKDFEDVQRLRKAAVQRGSDADFIESLRKAEAQRSRELQKWLKKHPLWSWLAEYPGLAGALTARILALVGDPRRFPGQTCDGEVRHYYPAGREIGSVCGRETTEGSCEGVMLVARPTTGVRSLWHYAGLHVIDGKMARKKKGVQADWQPMLRTLLLQPDGIADQIIKHRTPVYREVYDREKERLAQRIAEKTTASETFSGGAHSSGGDAEGTNERGSVAGISPHKVARVIVAKRFLGDLLVEWKRRVA